MGELLNLLMRTAARTPALWRGGAEAGEDTLSFFGKIGNFFRSSGAGKGAAAAEDVSGAASVAPSAEAAHEGTNILQQAEKDLSNAAEEAAAGAQAELDGIIKDFGKGRRPQVHAEPEVREALGQAKTVAPDAPKPETPAADTVEAGTKEGQQKLPPAPPKHRGLVGNILHMLNPMSAIPTKGGTVFKLIEEHLGTGFLGQSAKVLAFGGGLILAATGVLSLGSLAWGAVIKPVADFGAEVWHYGGETADVAGAGHDFQTGNLDGAGQKIASGLAGQGLWEFFNKIGLGGIYETIVELVSKTFGVDLNQYLTNMIDGGGAAAAITMNGQDAAALAGAKKALAAQGFLPAADASNMQTIGQLDADTITAYQKYLTQQGLYNGPVDGKVSGAFSDAMAAAQKAHPDIVPVAVASAVKGQVDAEFATLYQNTMGGNTPVSVTAAPTTAELAAQIQRQNPSLSAAQVQAMAAADAAQVDAQYAQKTNLVAALLTDAGVGPINTPAELSSALAAYQRQHDITGETGAVGLATFKSLLETASAHNASIAQVLSDDMNTLTGHAGLMGMLFGGHAEQTLVADITGAAAMGGGGMQMASSTPPAPLSTPMAPVQQAQPAPARAHAPT